MRLPHPVPYQGSKRRLAARILAATGGRRFDRLYEPFAGSAAITIAAADAGLARRFVIADSLAPLVGLWRQIIAEPQAIADGYERVWSQQHAEGPGHFGRIRREFNRDGDPAKLLYLLARCVKNSPRFNRRGDFNQSADLRRAGTAPARMRREIAGASRLLRHRTSQACDDFEATLRAAGGGDLVYLDPPWQGTCTGADRRYHAWPGRERVIEVLADLNRRRVPWILSYDGRHGSRRYGPPLPDSLGAARIELRAGRSSQATLHGRAATTIESLYVSRALA